MGNLFQKIRSGLRRMFQKMKSIFVRKPSGERELAAQKPQRKEKKSRKKSARKTRGTAPKKRSWRRWLKRSITAVLALLLVAAILAAVTTETLVASRKVIPQLSLTAEDILRRNNGTLGVKVVYSRDAWAKTAAEQLVQRLNAVEGITAQAREQVLYETPPSVSWSDMTIWLGHMDNVKGKSYFSEVARLGMNGLEITHEENENGITCRVNITAFCEEQLNRGIEKYMAYFLSTGGTYGTYGTVFSSEPSHAEGELPATVLQTDGEAFRICAAAYPGTDSYSLRALGTMTKELQPDFMVFWGTPDLGVDRETIANSWGKVLGAVTPTCRDLTVLPIPGIPGTENAGITADTLPTLLPAETGRVTEQGYRVIVNADNIPFAAEYYLTGTESSALAACAEQIRSTSALLSRATYGNLTQILYLPAIPTDVAALLPTEYGFEGSSGVVFNEPYAEYVSDAVNPLYRTALAYGVRSFVCNAGYTDIGVLTTETDGQLVNIGFCGSVGFQNPGIGGKFALNNSLRGVLSLWIGSKKVKEWENMLPEELLSKTAFSIHLGEVTYLTTAMEYVRASAYGLTEKNAE